MDYDKDYESEIMQLRRKLIETRIELKNAKANEDRMRMLYQATFDALQHAENELDEVYEERDIMHNALSKVHDIVSNELDEPEYEDDDEIWLYCSSDRILVL